MLSEHFVASIGSPLKTQAAGSKDVSIFVNELQPLAGIRQAFKKSATAQNCLAVSETHIYAAQAEKAVVHVYNRDKGNHEATIPFNEKITCLALALSGLVLLLGTEGGRILAWELATGRLISTPQSHLQAVTCIAIDPTSNFFLSGSRDSNVLVWSLSALHSFTSSDSPGQGSMSPVHSLSTQRGAVTALAVGHGHGRTNIAVSASEDQSAVIWDYKKGVALGTYLLRAVPRALALDKSDRGFYVTYDDGTVQTVDFFSDGQHTNTLHDEAITAPVQPGDEGLCKAEGQELGEGLSLALCWDGSRLLSGHKSGKIACWDIGKGSFISILETLPGTATNIVMTPVRNTMDMNNGKLRLNEIVKPRISTSEVEGIVPGDYALAATFASKMNATHVHATRPAESTRKSRFQSALSQPGFPSDFLEIRLAELGQGMTPANKTSTGDAPLNEESRKELDAAKAQNEVLQQQIEHLQKLQRASFVQLRDKNKAISALVQEQAHLAEIAKAEHGWSIVDANVEWHAFQQRQKTGQLSNGKGKSADEEMTDGD